MGIHDFSMGRRAFWASLSNPEYDFDFSDGIRPEIDEEDDEQDIFTRNEDEDDDGNISKISPADVFFDTVLVDQIDRSFIGAKEDIQNGVSPMFGVKADNLLLDIEKVIHRKYNPRTPTLIRSISQQSTHQAKNDRRIRRQKKILARQAANGACRLKETLATHAKMKAYLDSRRAKKQEKTFPGVCFPGTIYPLPVIIPPEKSTLTPEKHETVKNPIQLTKPPLQPYPNDYLVRLEAAEEEHIRLKISRPSPKTPSFISTINPKKPQIIHAIADAWAMKQIDILKSQGLITVHGEWIDIDTIHLGENPGKRLRIMEIDLKKRLMKTYKNRC